MNWSVRYAIAQRAQGTEGNPLIPSAVQTLSSACNNFYGNGGSIEIHNFADGKQVNVDAKRSAGYATQLQQTQGIQESNPVVGKAKSWLSTCLDRLSKAYSTGNPGAGGANPNRTVLLAKDKNGNAVGHLAVTPSEDGKSHEVIGLSALPGNHGAAYALQHALVKHVLAPQGSDLKSKIYSHYTAPDVRDNALQFHQDIGRRIGTPTSKYKSSWTAGDVQDIANGTQVDNENVLNVGGR